MLLTPRAAVWAYTVLVAALVARFLLEIPVQLTDSFLNIVGVATHSMSETLAANLRNGAYLRPFLFVPIKAVYELSNGHYTAGYRGTHTLQIVLTIILFVKLLRVRTWTQASAAPLGIAMLLGLHTFAGVAREAFPINAYLTVVDACLLTALVAVSPHRWWSDVAVVVLLVVAALSVESGLLVAVIAAAGYVAGWRGVSRRGLVACGAAVAAYFVVRMTMLEESVPGLSERSTGFLFRVLDPPEVMARFGANPWPLYAYNVLASIGSVLFAEPRGGVFQVVRAVMADGVTPSDIINVVACTGVTLMIVGYAIGARARWRRWELTDDDRVLVVCAALLVANAGLSLVYTKDVIMSPAGAFFALAGYVVITRAIEAVRAMSLVPSMACSVLLLTFVAVPWSIKQVGLHYSIRYLATTVRDDWALVDAWIDQQQVDVSSPQAMHIKQTLEADALWNRPRLSDFGRWHELERWFDHTQ